jgi:hypothetical protein
MRSAEFSTADAIAGREAMRQIHERRRKKHVTRLSLGDER